MVVDLHAATYRETVLKCGVLIIGDDVNGSNHTVLLMTDGHKNQQRIIHLVIFSQNLLIDVHALYSIHTHYHMIPLGTINFINKS